MDVDLETPKVDLETPSHVDLETGKVDLETANQVDLTSAGTGTVRACLDEVINYSDFFP